MKHEFPLDNIMERKWIGRRLEIETRIWDGGMRQLVNVTG